MFTSCETYIHGMNFCLLICCKRFIDYSSHIRYFLVIKIYPITTYCVWFSIIYTTPICKAILYLRVVPRFIFFSKGLVFLNLLFVTEVFNDFVLILNEYILLVRFNDFLIDLDLLFDFWVFLWKVSNYFLRDKVL